MTSNKPYLIRAMHEWISDNHCTPYLYINTQVEGVLLPEHLLAENPLILNVSASACKDLVLGNNTIHFQARFSGQVYEVSLPIDSVMAIAARESGQGMSFELEHLSQGGAESEEQSSDASSSDSPKSSAKSGLKIIR